MIKRIYMDRSIELFFKKIIIILSQKTYNMTILIMEGNLLKCFLDSKSNGNLTTIYIVRE